MAPTVFDRTAVLDALEPPQFLDAGRVFTGVVLSAPVWFAHTHLIEPMGKDARADQARIRAICDLFFPPPARPWWQRLFWWRPRPTTVADLVSDLPYGLQLDAIATFVSAQVSAMQTTAMPGRRETERSSPMEKTPSSVEPG